MAAEFHARRSSSSTDRFPDPGSPLWFSAQWVLERWTDGQCVEPLLVWLEDRGRGCTVRVAPTSWRPSELYRLDDRAAATDLLAQIAWTWNPKP
jgi:hypothetical protein